MRKKRNILIRMFVATGHGLRFAWIHRRDWVKPLLYTLVVTATVAAVFVIAGPHRFRYWTDGLVVRRAATEAAPRFILWEEPVLVQGALNEEAGAIEPTLSGDGQTMVFARSRPGRDADLYMARRSNGGWGEATPLSSLNTEADELGPQLTHDGRYLYFYSNRPGGRGGYDIWVAKWDSAKWTGTVNLGENVNSAFNDCDPALTPRADRLYFVSDRPMPAKRRRSEAAEAARRTARCYDIFVCAAKLKEKEAPGQILPVTPRFWLAERLPIVSSPDNERHVTLAPRGDLLYFSSDRDGGYGAYDLYRARLIQGRLMPPVNLGAQVNTAAAERDPALYMEGFGLLFRSDRHTEQGRGPFLYRTVSREVVMRTDLTLLHELLGPLLLLAAALGAILYLLRLLFNAELRKERSLMHKCFLASLLLHLLLILLLGFWMISSKIQEVMEGRPMEIAVNINALARESVALAIREQVAALPKVKEARPMKQQIERLTIPAMRPVEETTAPPAPDQAVETYAIRVEEVMQEAVARDELPTLERIVKLAALPAEAPSVVMEMLQSPAEQGPDRRRPISKQKPSLKPLEQEPEQVKREHVPKRVSLAKLATPGPLQDQPLEFTHQPHLTAATNALADIAEQDNVAALEGEFPVSEAQSFARIGPSRKEFGESSGTLVLPIAVVMETRPNRKPRKPDASLGPISRDKTVATMSSLPLSHSSHALHDSGLAVAEPTLPRGVALAPAQPRVSQARARSLGRVGDAITGRIPLLTIPAEEELEVPYKTFGVRQFDCRLQPRPAAQARVRSPGTAELAK